jgi:Ca2+-transporting ATPase
MDAATLAAKVRSVNVYARMVPEQKLELVQAMKANGDIVAMTGDGVNDAPALKAAHIGVAMGTRGSDVAREAAGLVLLDDDFSALVAAVRTGRRIFDSIRHAMSYLVAVHIPLGGMGLLPALLGWPLFLLPVHVVFLEFVIDPACSLVFQAERGAPDLMRRPPRAVGERLFNVRFLTAATLLGIFVLVAVVAAYAIVLHSRGADAARACAFATLIVANVLLIATSRSRTVPAVALLFRPNAAFAAIAGGVTAALAIALYWPPALHLFRFEAPTLRELAMAIALGAASVLWYDLVKLGRWRATQKRGDNRQHA